MHDRRYPAGRAGLIRYRLLHCGACTGFEREFSPRRARKLADQYHKSGASTTTRLLAQALQRKGVRDMTLLDIGGGLGALQHSLLAAGAGGAIAVEASRACLDVAQQEARRLGWSERIEFQFGDFTELAPVLPAADIVTLDRVICCYRDMPGLVGLSAARATRYYGAVFPRDRWWVRLWNWAENRLHWLQRSGFRSFVHSPDQIDRCLRDGGLEVCFSDYTLAWHVVVYERG